MENKQRIVIIGATSAIAEHCARLWVQSKPVDLTLVGRNTEKLKQIALDLKVRSPQSDIRTLRADFLEPSIIQATVRGIVDLGIVDILLIAHGSLPQQESCQNDLQICREALEINGISPVLYAEAFANHMAKADHGTIAMIGSVAGDRGRKSNYVYGAAKGLVARYAQGLQHRFAGTGVNVVLIKPGPTDTPMTAHLKKEGAKLAPLHDVAQNIVRAIEHRKSTVYAPQKWKLIMLIITHLPDLIFKRLSI